MSRIRRLPALFLVFGLFTGVAAHADIYEASQAYKQKDFPKAFQLFRELAELGNVYAQESIAIMYVNGEGVKRDNVLGYAWASISIDNGGVDEGIRNIVNQLEPHVTAGARTRIDAMKTQFGAQGLQKTLLPNIFAKADYADREPCHMLKHDPGYYPAEAQDKGVQGQAYVEFTVMPDGRARNPRVVYAVPAGYFEEASRATILKSKFQPAKTKEGFVPCTMAVMFRYQMNIKASEYTKLDDYVNDAKTKAEAGDPGSQMVYGLLLSGLPQLKSTRGDAMPWFLKSAQAGVASAQYMVGVSAMKGWGCQCEEPKGLVWLHKAAAADQSDAQVSLANYLLRDQPTAEDAAKARTWLERAVSHDNRDGKFYLAALLAAGPDPAMRDPKRSLELLKSVMRDMDQDPTAFEIRAAANATLGNFDAAQKDQAKALRMAQKLEWDVAPQQARLKNYQDKQSFTGELFEF
jgi:TonB family protein